MRVVIALRLKLAFLEWRDGPWQSLLTDNPGGVARMLSFRGHRTGDMIQAAAAGLGPALFGFARPRVDS